MATLDVKFTKFDNRPWGFRLAGGSDFPQPLTVIRVTEESLAECMGLKVGDVVVKLNDQLITDLTHGQAHEALTLAGNNFVLGVRRTEDPSKAVESIEDNIEPYMLPIEEILFAPIEETRETKPNEAPQIEDECVQPVEAEQADIEIYPEKPRDENSDIVPNTNLTEEEIAQLILDEEEILNEKGVLGVNFKKLRPRAPLFKQSKVFQELQEEVNSVNSDPAEAEKRRLLASTFLRKPERPIPKPQSEEKTEPEVEPYRVVIKKQPKKSITKRLLEQGLLEPSRVKTPEATTQATEVKEPEIQTLTNGTWSFTCSIDETTPSMIMETMLPIKEGSEEYPTYAHVPIEPALPILTRAYDEIIPPSFVAVKSTVKPRFCRRGRYAKRCLNRALDSLKTCGTKTKPRLLRRAHYFERIVADIKRSISSEKELTPCSEESFLRVLMLATLAHSLRDTYDTEILHRGSSRRNSRRMSSRRESNASNLNDFDSGFFMKRKDVDNLSSFQNKCAAGRRRLSSISMMVADKVGNAIRTDLARGIAYAMVPCASALAFFMFNYAKRFNNNE